MALPHVSTGDPHVAAHNAERDAINSLNKGTIGLGNVDNTSDANKPVSTAQANAIKDRLTAQPIAAGVDLNSLTTSGNYYQTTSTNSTLALNYPEEAFSGYLEVIGGVSLSYAKQTMSHIALGLYAKTFNKYERVMYGVNKWKPWVVVPTLDDSLGQSYGVGFPNGVVLADPGSTYTDTETTNGAIQWTKKSSTNQYGWVVSVGDTGWQDITSLRLDEDWSDDTNAPVFRIKRMNNIVNLEGRVVRKADDNSIFQSHRRRCGVCFSQWQSSRAPFGSVINYTKNLQGQMSAYLGNTLYLSNFPEGSAWAPGDRVFFSANYLTDDPWPSAPLGGA